MRQRLSMTITGSVQGVGFRWSAREAAVGFRLTGLARNLPDGSVQIIAEGEREQLQKLLAWARQGPRLAKIGAVAVEWDEPSGGFKEFQIL